MFGIEVKQYAEILRVSALGDIYWGVDGRNRRCENGKPFAKTKIPNVSGLWRDLTVSLAGKIYTYWIFCAVCPTAHCF